MRAPQRAARTMFLSTLCWAHVRYEAGLHRARCARTAPDRFRQQTSWCRLGAGAVRCVGWAADAGARTTTLAPRNYNRCCMTGRANWDHSSACRASWLSANRGCSPTRAVCCPKRKASTQHADRPRWAPRSLPGSRIGYARNCKTEKTKTATWQTRHLATHRLSIHSLHRLEAHRHVSRATGRACRRSSRATRA